MLRIHREFSCRRFAVLCHRTTCDLYQDGGAIDIGVKPLPDPENVSAIRSHFLAMKAVELSQPLATRFGGHK
jgi:hypothetical protein